MFEGIYRSGIYLDTTSLSNLLAESRNEQLASYLRPFKSFILTSEMRGQSNHIHIRALLSRID